MEIPKKTIQTELLNVFAIPRGVLIFFFAFMMLGNVAAIFIDGANGSSLLVASDMAGLVVIGVLFALGGSGRINGNITLALSVLVAVCLFIVGAIISFAENPGRVDADYLLSTMFVTVITAILGFFVDRRLAVFMGLLSFSYVSVTAVVLRTPFILTNLALILMVAAGSAMIGFYYRHKLEILVRNLIQGRMQVENSLSELQTAQKRIVTQEKLATLGTLVSGISHELRNPLNFINNFSEINCDLMAVLSTQLDPHLADLPPATRQNIESLMNEISHNLKDISEHGRRGTAIIQSMLMHNRGPGAQPVPTDFNELVRQGSGLALHGYRAREHFYNLNLVYDLDPRIGEVLVIPHELNRAVLNLCANAFYETHHRSLKPGQSEYHPMVHIKTVLSTSPEGGEEIVLTVRDNGPGIPVQYMDKIFLPFFTSKPTGDGTGLGLSMAWEIVTTGHEGTLIANNHPDGGAEFVVHLPVRRATASREPREGVNPVSRPGADPADEGRVVPKGSGTSA